MKSDRVLSTAEERRAKVVASAVAAFARGGLHAVTVADVAKHAGISPAYVLKLFTSKTQLFAAALDECYRRIGEAMERGAAQAEEETPEALLHTMGGAYAELIGERDLLMLQVHAQSAMAEPLIADAVRRGAAGITDYVAARSKASGRQVQEFMAFGQLCHLLTTIDAFGIDEPWAKLLTEGFRHSDPIEPPGGAPD
ncbi:TetR/AcrR family transcriptional regulator [Glycomyces sp. A-F 0318]|uniref:TetR/AcrR family transcriptional regulator n=1 Tax=Glycomyces amatae TaxID=2881355 RepID=UPI001E5B1D59|nr:TetR/AcrR family transcriptional regulator [Glycomyces amatae]MCD0445343.1 TetR/AcrR family transcriptional regulator [Glycomyces amatae]